MIDILLNEQKSVTRADLEIAGADTRIINLDALNKRLQTIVGKEVVLEKEDKDLVGETERAVIKSCVKRCEEGREERVVMTYSTRGKGSEHDMEKIWSVEGRSFVFTEGWIGQEKVLMFQWNAQGSIGLGLSKSRKIRLVNV